MPRRYPRAVFLCCCLSLVTLVSGCGSGSNSTSPPFTRAYSFGLTGGVQDVTVSPTGDVVVLSVGAIERYANRGQPGDETTTPNMTINAAALTAAGLPAGSLHDCSIAVSPRNGDIYLSSGGSVTVFRSTGDFLFRFGHSIENRGIASRGIAIDSTGNVYVVERGGTTGPDSRQYSGIAVFNAEGEYLRSLQGLEVPARLHEAGISTFTMDKHDNLYVIDRGTHVIPGDTYTAIDGTTKVASTDTYVRGTRKVSVYSSSGGHLHDIPLPFAIFDDNGYDYAVDASGNLYLSSVLFGSIKEYSPTGTLLATIDEFPSGVGAGALSVDEQGTLYVSRGKVINSPRAVTAFRPN
jgi:hypothetical protein